MGRDRLDILHDRLDGLLGLVAVAVKGTLQEHRTASEDTALQPGHAVAKIVETDLLATDAATDPGDGQLQLGAITAGHLDHGLTTASHAPTSAATVSVSVAIILSVGEVVQEKPRTSGAGRRTLHLTSEVRARVNGRALAEGVGNLASVDAIESNADAETTLAVAVLNQDELALLGLRNVWEEIFDLVGTRSARVTTTGGDSVVTVAQCVLQRRHGGASGSVAAIATIAAVKDLIVADVVAGAGGLASWSLVVMMVLIIHVIPVTYQERNAVSMMVTMSTKGKQTKVGPRSDLSHGICGGTCWFET